MLGARRLLGALRLCSSVSCPRPRASVRLRVRDALGVQDASGERVTVQVGVWEGVCWGLLGPATSFTLRGPLGPSVGRAHFSVTVL